MKTRNLGFVSLLVLLGCSTASQQVYLPDGTSGYRITCNDGINNLGECIKSAGNLCGELGYYTFDTAGHMQNPNIQNQTAIAALNRPTEINYWSKDSEQYMFVKCKGNTEQK